MKCLPQGGSLANGNFGLSDVENESEAATSLGISEHLYMFAGEVFRPHAHILSQRRFRERKEI